MTQQEKLDFVSGHIRNIIESCRQVRLTHEHQARMIFGLDHVGAGFAIDLTLSAIHDMADALDWQLSELAEATSMGYARHPSSRELPARSTVNGSHGEAPVIAAHAATAMIDDEAA